MFEPITSNETNDLSFFDRLNQNGNKIIQFQENQAQIQKSLSELTQSSLNLTQNSSITDIKESLFKIVSSLDKIRENSLINGEIINQIRNEHELLEEEFYRIQKSNENKGELEDILELISDK